MTQIVVTAFACLLCTWMITLLWQGYPDGEPGTAASEFAVRLGASVFPSVVFLCSLGWLVEAFA